MRTRLTCIATAFALTLVACGSEDPYAECNSRTHCELDERGYPTCEVGYEWENEYDQDNYRCVSHDGRSSVGTGSHDTQTDSSPVAPSVSESVVGVWFGAMRCSNGTDTIEFNYAWALCPDGNLNGFEILDIEGSTTFELLDEGVYDVSEASGEVRAGYRSTVVEPSAVRGESGWVDSLLHYDTNADTLTFTSGCPVVMERIGVASNAECP